MHPGSALVTATTSWPTRRPANCRLVASGVSVDNTLIQPEGDGPTAQTA